MIALRVRSLVESINSYLNFSVLLLLYLIDASLSYHKKLHRRAKYRITIKIKNK